MSGICGVLRLDGADAEVSEVGAMTAAMAHRGPDGTRHWAGGSAALGHALLATTPEAAVERLPLVDPASACVITADARLDNRDELIAALGLDAAGRTIGDGELILAAYLRWGEDCAARLLGDFAFAIWDPRARSLFAARDQMGMRQFNYCPVAGQAFLFATEVAGVLAHPLAPRRVNQARIADFLDDLEGHDFESTFFEQVSRLPPGHLLVLRENRVATRRYWALEIPPQLELESDEAYEKAFLDVFTEAVRCRLRSDGDVGIALSGGVDSNAVAGVAAQLLADEGRPLRAFSVIGHDPLRAAEGEAIRDASAMTNVASEWIETRSLGPLRERLAEAALASSEPFDAHMNLARAIYTRAQESEVRVILDGVGGDVVLSGGNVIAERLRAGRLGAALAELDWQPRTLYQWASQVRQMLASVFIAFAPRAMVRVRRRMTAAWHNRRAAAGKIAISPDFAKAIDLPARRANLARHADTLSPFGRDYRRQVVLHPHLTVGRERYDRVAGAYGVEPRDPFLDLRVIRFCLSLPLDQVQRRGVTKSILRRALKDLCAQAAIAYRPRWHYGWDLTQVLLPRIAEMTALDRERLRPLVSSTRLESAAPEAANPLDRHHWFELCVLDQWLYRNRPRNCGVE